MRRRIYWTLIWTLLCGVLIWGTGCQTRTDQAIDDMTNETLATESNNDITGTSAEQISEPSSQNESTESLESTESTETSNINDVNASTAPVQPTTEAQPSTQASPTTSTNTSLVGVELFNTLNHPGFKGITAIYDKTTTNWTDFFGEIQSSDYSVEITSHLLGQDVYEMEYASEYTEYHRLYVKNSGVFKEVSVLGMEDGTKTTLGFMSHVAVVPDPPTYNPYYLKQGESLIDCIYVEYEGKSAVKLDSNYDGKTYVKWIDPEIGLMIKQEISDENDRIIEKWLLKDIQHDANMSASNFAIPYTADYMDISILLYEKFGGDLDTLKSALTHSLPAEPFKIHFVADNGDWIDYHTGGYRGQQFIDQYIVVREVLDENSAPIIIKQYFDDPNFYTIVDVKELVEIYKYNAYGLRLFDFEYTGFREKIEADETVTYVFEDYMFPSTSGIRRFYHYPIDLNSGKFTAIKIVDCKCEGENKDIISETSYEFNSWGEADPSLIEYPDAYRKIEGETFDDSRIPGWYP